MDTKGAVTMTKKMLIYITGCNQGCPNWDDDGYCMMEGYALEKPNDPFEIPDWCPLEDAK